MTASPSPGPAHIPPGGSAGLLSRRRLLLGAAAVGATALLTEGFIFQRGRLEVTRPTLGEPGPGRRSLRLAVLADLHLTVLGRFHEELAGALAEEDPDAVLLVGDSVDRPDALPLLRDFLALLPDRPSFATLGNWEYWGGVDLPALRRTYADAGVRLLVNEGAELAPGAAIWGVDDPLAGSPALPTPGDPPAGDLLLLSHCPFYRDELPTGPGHRLAAVLSGHTHGGQLAVGGWAPVLPPGSGGYVAGWYREGGVPLYVTRGVGTSVIPFRLGSVPELTLLEWTPRPNP